MLFHYRQSGNWYLEPGFQPSLHRPAGDEVDDQVGFHADGALQQDGGRTGLLRGAADAGG